MIKTRITSSHLRRCSWKCFGFYLFLKYYIYSTFIQPTNQFIVIALLSVHPRGAGWGWGQGSVLTSQIISHQTGNKHFFMELALCREDLSCCNRKDTNTNCWYVGALKRPLTGTKRPKPGKTANPKYTDITSDTTED